MTSEPTPPTVPQGTEIDALIERLRTRAETGVRVLSASEALERVRDDNLAVSALVRLRPTKPLPTGMRERAETKLREMAGQPLAEDLASPELADFQAGYEALVRAARSLLAELTQAGTEDGWRTIDSAPKDGTKIDLLYPYPRGRQIDCYWASGGIWEGGHWLRCEPSWKNGVLLAEDEWQTVALPNMQPTHWRLPPAAHSPDESTP